MNPEGQSDRNTLKLALVAGILVLPSLSLMSYAYSNFQENLLLGRSLIAFNGAIMLLLLLAVWSAVFDRVDRARDFLAIGMVGLVISVVIHTVRMIDRFGQWG